MKSIYTIFTLVLLFVFTSSLMGQIDWTKHPDNPVFTDTTGEWASGFAFAPYVIIIDSTYHMWYCSADGSMIVRIGYATSSDGITWEPYANNLVLDVGLAESWEPTRVSDPTIIYDGSTFHMWYTGMKETNPYWNESIGYATSPDGITWTKYVDNPVLEKGPPGSWDDTQIWHCSVYYDGMTFHMWYSGRSSNNSRQIGYATSSDGISWEKYEGNPVLRAGSSLNWDYPEVRLPRVLVDGTTYHMFYTAGLWHEWRIGYATSADGINWTKYVNNPVLDKGQPGSWDTYYIMNTSVILDTASSIFRMWYHGGARRFDAHIGYATAPAIINVPGNFETIQSAIDAAQNGNIVLVEEGTYSENINFKGKAITVASQFYMDGDTSHISNTVIDGSQNTNPDSGSVVYFVSGEDTTSVLMGVTITGGSGTYNEEFDMYGGGGILMSAGGKVLHNKITGNHLVSQKGSYGAGIVASSYNMAGNIVIEHNDVKFNSIVSPRQSLGGGIHIPLRWWTGGYCRVKKNSISYNSVTVTGTYKAIAGGITLSFSLPTVGSVIIENNIISHNELHCVASMGAGIYVVYFDPGYAIVDEIPTPLIRNNIITNNYSEDKGGGLAIWTVEFEHGHQPNSIISPQPAFINNTIVNNKANDGCGLFNFDSYPLLMNNILWNDLSESGSREIFNDDITYPEYPDHTNNGDISAYYSDIQGGWEEETNIDADPQFLDTLTYNLSELSPCVGSGIDSLQIADIWYSCPVTDFSGRQRPDPVDLYVDMGAQESTFPNGIDNEKDIIFT